ncbi:MAG: hypothetical protein FVQ85_19695 [Planctomycetes bacterium]|nr:hypothetical protein [Planctomycetota bacterium]
MRKLIVLAAVLTLGVYSIPAQASVTYNFAHIVEEGDGEPEFANGAIGESQMIVTVEAEGDQVLFTFENLLIVDGCEDCAITGVYFYDGALLGISELRDSDDGDPTGDPGVDFTEDAIDPVKPKDLPGAKKLVVCL